MVQQRGTISQMYAGVHCSDMSTSQLFQKILRNQFYIDFVSAILKTWDRESKIDFSPNAMVLLNEHPRIPMLCRRGIAGFMKYICLGTG